MEKEAEALRNGHTQLEQGRAARVGHLELVNHGCKCTDPIGESFLVERQNPLQTGKDGTTILMASGAEGLCPLLLLLFLPTSRAPSPSS